MMRWILLLIIPFFLAHLDQPAPNYTTSTEVKTVPDTLIVAARDSALAMRDSLPMVVDTNILKTIDTGMARVLGGTFTMGCKESNCGIWAVPAHTVTVSDFKISKYLVTQAQWTAIMGKNPSAFKGCGKCPVEKVSFTDVQKFIARLNQLTGLKYRLPTEAEWEYAAHGGVKTRGYKYAGATYPIGWCQENSEGHTHPIATKVNNELGLFDMMGNVWEWCNDKYGPYKKDAVKNPAGPDAGNNRVIRGCAWNVTVQTAKIIMRSPQAPEMRTNDVGFRLARDADPPPPQK
jgi:sulfatase modifying factor 1